MDEVLKLINELNSINETLYRDKNLTETDMAYLSNKFLILLKKTEYLIKQGEDKDETK